jgi:transcription-repair coupling factor (superfamily II helicase)
LRTRRPGGSTLFGDEIEAIAEFDPLTGQKTGDLKSVKIYANSHYVTPRPTLNQAVKSIKEELKHRLAELKLRAGKLLEAQRLEQRTRFDLEMLEATGSAQGIENYSRYLTGRGPGEPPPTLFEYLPDNALLFIDESHVTDPADRRHVSRRLPPQGDPGRIRLPAAVCARQPAAALRGVGRDAARRPSPSRPPPATGRWSRPAASSPNR